ncbi:MAG: two-component system sensor histidine kinase NtrB [Candidatus Binatia bacterium]
MSRETTPKIPAKTFCPLPSDEKFLTTLSEGLIEAVFLVEPGLRSVAYFNAGAEALFGYPAAEIVEQTTERLFTVRSSFERLYQLAVSEINQNGFWRGEWEYRRRGGGHFTAATTATLVRRDAGSYLTLVVREISNRKETEDVVHHVNRHVAERVTETTAEVVSPTQKIENKEAQREEIARIHMAAIGAAAAMLAHEIKNPLNGISTTVQLLQRSLSKTEPTKERMLAAVRDLENEICRLQALLGDFQTISAPQRLSLRSVDLAQLLREVKALTIEECKKNKIEVRVDSEADLPLVEGDPDRLKQALLNLIKNGCEAMPKGGALTLKGYVSGKQICLDVTDTGEGIPEGMQIFDLFTSTKPGGTGLGLVIVQQIILAHGGGVSFSSEPGKGTTFQLTFRGAKESRS